MLGTPGIASSAVGSGLGAAGGGGGTAAGGGWKEHLLDEVPVAAEDVGDAVTCLLHTILFTRAPGPVRPSEATCQAFPNITYALCAVGDVSRKVDQAVRGFEEALALLGGSAAASSYLLGGGSSVMTPYGQPSVHSVGGVGGSSSGVRGANSGYIVVTFFERKVKKALFGLMSNEEKAVFEKWILPVTVTSSPAASQEERELCAGETEATLQNALLHIVTAVQSIEHIPTAMYDFEITTFNSLEEAQVGSSYGGGLGSPSVRLMP
ncbi:DNA-binding HORMA [Phytophthora cinnamomi]|uniref:DNA-binding HORMA n=1 Tax=Phytophthora cinnamomi TaxID=4785 RepID=UPI00355A03E5|nr:DNA-binding HORMA [Phytophthora cinnamomi]